MTVYRTFHDKNNPYVQINKKTLCNPDLSFHAAGLWTRLMSRPDDWHFSIAELSKTFKVSELLLRKWFKELEIAGLAVRFQHKINGKFGHWETIIFESKQSLDDLKKIVPNLDLLNSVALNSAERTLLNIDSTNPPNPPIPSVGTNTNTKDKSPLPPSGGGEARPRPGGTGSAIEISKKSFEESKKALREIKIEVDGEEKFIHPRMIDKLAKELTAEEIKNAEAYVAYCLEDEEFEIENLVGFLIHALREKKSPPDANSLTNIQYAKARKKEWKLKNLSIYQDCVYDCEKGKELFNNMNANAFRQAFDGTFGPKADALMGGKSWGV